MVLAQHAKNKQHVPNAPEPNNHEHVRLPNKEEEMLASAVGASEEIWSVLRLCEFYAKVPIGKLCLAESAQDAEYSENATKLLTYEYVGFARASRTKRNVLASDEGSSGEELEHSMQVLRKSAFCTTVTSVLCTKSTKHAVF